MPNRGKKILFVIGEHCLFVILSVFFSSTFLTLLAKHTYVISIVTALLYISSTYSAGWTASYKDYAAAKEQLRINGTPDAKPDYCIFSGFIIALPNLIITGLLGLMYYLKGELWILIYRLYNFSFIYLITDKNNDLIVWACFLVAVITYLAYAIGYVMGKNKKIMLIKYIPKAIYKPNRE